MSVTVTLSSVSLLSESLNLRVILEAPKEQFSWLHCLCLLPIITFCFIAGPGSLHVPLYLSLRISLPPSLHCPVMASVVSEIHPQSCSWFILAPRKSQPSQSAQVFSPQIREVREFFIKAEQLLGRVSIVTIKGTWRESSQISFKLLSNPKMLVVRCVYLDWMIFILKQRQDFQVQMSSQMHCVDKWKWERIFSGLGSAGEARGKQGAQTAGRTWSPGNW